MEAHRPGGGEDAVGDLLQPGEDRTGPGPAAVHRQPLAYTDLAGQVDDAGLDVIDLELEAEGADGGCGRGDRGRRTAHAPVAGRVVLLDERPVEEVADQGRDRRLGEAGV